MNRESFNLKWPIATGLFVAGTGPLAGNFIYSMVKMHSLDPRTATPADLSFLGDTFTAVCIFAGCVLTLPILLAISRRPAFAALCAHDPEQVSRTIRAARRAAWVVLAMTLLCIIQFIHVAFF